MKKKLIITILALAMVLGMAACGGNETTTTTAAPTESTTENADGTEATDETTAGAEDVSIILVTMDGLDNHWVNVDKGAQAAAEELGIKYQWMAPDKKDTALQIEMLNNAIAAQCDGLVVAAVDPDAVVATLQSAEDAESKLFMLTLLLNLRL